jgi:hypothetical protein
MSWNERDGVDMYGVIDMSQMTKVIVDVADGD